MDDFMNKPQNIVVVGDMYVASETMKDALQKSCINCGEIKQLFWGDYNKDNFAFHQQNLENHGPEAAPFAEGLEQVVEDAEIIMTHFSPIPRSIIEKAKNLKLILSCRGGIEHVDTKAASERNIPVVNVIRNAEPVADFALGMMLDLTRNITLSDKNIRKGEWLHKYYNSDQVKLFNSHVVGLIGVGNVGAALARRLNALGVPVMAYDAFVSKEDFEKQGLGFIEKVDSMDEVFEKADIVSLHLRLTPETEGIIDGHYFKKMKKTAYFINTARGALIDEAALAESLLAGDLKGAALDVVKKEPLPDESPLKGMDNVLLTSHIAAMTVDAISGAPYLLMNEADRMIQDKMTNRIVNYKNITL